MLAWVYLGLSCLEFAQILKFVGLCLFAKFGKFFIHYVFEYVFSSAPFLFSFQDSVDMNGSSFVVFTKVPEALFTFFSVHPLEVPRTSSSCNIFGVSFSFPALRQEMQKCTVRKTEKLASNIFPMEGSQLESG